MRAVPADHVLLRMHRAVDWPAVEPQLERDYDPAQGRPGYPPPPFSSACWSWSRMGTSVTGRSTRRSAPTSSTGPSWAWAPTRSCPTTRPWSASGSGSGRPPADLRAPQRPGGRRGAAGRRAPGLRRRPPLGQGGPAVLGQPDARGAPARRGGGGPRGPAAGREPPRDLRPPAGGARAPRRGGAAGRERADGGVAGGGPSWPGRATGW
jgi:hypothetical protein